MRNSTNKYFDVLQLISEQKSFYSKPMLRKFKITNNFITAGKDMGLFKRVSDGEYVWNLNRSPLIKDVHEMQLRIRAASTSARLKAKAQPKNQLKLQPIKRVELIKRVEAPVPQSIIELNEKISEYPILDVAIAFLAGMLVAAFFTLIWK